MRFQIHFAAAQGDKAQDAGTEPGDGAASVIVTVHQDGALLASHSLRRSLGGALIPPASLVNVIADRGEPEPGLTLQIAGSGHAALPDAFDPDEVRAKIDRRDASASDIVLYGQYLFALLLGPDGFAAILARARTQGDSSVVLALSADPGFADLLLLPWELAHGPDGSLAKATMPTVAFARMIAGPRAALAALSLPLSVLFVVGSHEQDAVIRPGLEYLGLLRHLERSSTKLRSTLLLSATLDDVRRSVRRLQPQLVHFITHGDIRADGRGVIELCDPDDRQRRRSYDARTLYDHALAADGAPPTVVVVNACKSGGADGLALRAAPIAAGLVHAGVPCAVGMGGEVTDDACRLFTRAFYEAFIAGEPLAEAAAFGRRRGVAAHAAPGSADWAMPAVFVRADLQGAIAVAPRQGARDLDRISQGLRLDQNPRAFVDRLDFEAQLGRLVDDEAGLQIVVAYERGAGDSTRRHGKSRLLRELAAKAVRDGHVPVLLTFDEGDTRPATLAELCLLAGSQIEAMRAAFGLPAVADLAVYVTAEVTDFADRSQTDPLPEPVRKKLRGAMAADRPALALETALREDLRSLRSDAQAALGAETRVIVFLDDVHRMGTASVDLFSRLQKPMGRTYGLGTPDCPVPVVMACTRDDSRAGEHDAQQALKRFIESSSGHVLCLPLGKIAETSRESGAYTHYLLYFEHRMDDGKEMRGPYVVARQREVVFDYLHKKLEGIPSFLRHRKSDVAFLIAMLADLGHLYQGNDEDILQELRSHGE